LRIIIKAVILFFLPLLVFPAHGACESTRIIMVTEHWPPFRIIDDASPSGFRGIDIEIAEKIAEATGTTIDIQHHPWARALEQMESGEADLITGIAYTEERATFLHYIPVAYSEVHPVFITSKDKASTIRTYEDLHGPSIGFSLNSAYFEPFDSDPKIKRMGFSTENQLLKVMTLGRVDVIIGTDPNITYEINRLDDGSKLAPTEYRPAQKTELYFALSRKSPAMEFADEIETALRRLVDTGIVETILESYR
jgi:polar amino acid transport system substrate-binding protein